MTYERAAHSPVHDYLTADYNDYAMEHSPASRSRSREPLFLPALGVAVALIAGLGVSYARAQMASTTPACSITANPGSVMPGDSSVLSWTTENATSFSLSNLGAESMVATGTATVTPAAPSTIYTGTASGPSGTGTCSVAVSVTSTSVPSPSVPSGSASGTALAPSSFAPSPPSVPAVPATGTTPAPEAVSIGADGTALVRGTVTAVAPNDLTVASWGGLWDIRSGGPGATTAVPAGPSSDSDFSNIRVGDFVGVDGIAMNSAPSSVNATFVRDWTTNPVVASVPASPTPQSASSTLPAPVPSTSPSTGTSTGSPSSQLPAGVSLYTGTASNVDPTSGSFTLTDSSGNAYTVTTDANTTLWNSAGTDIPFSSIQNGDSVRLDGTATDATTIAATVVRDTNF